MAFEGIDYCGKSTQAKMMAESLSSEGIECLLTRQPGGARCLQVRDLLLGPTGGDLCAKSRHLLFAADNAQHIHDTVAPALDDGKAVVMDRGIGSALAYQGFGESVGIEQVQRTYGWATDWFYPNVTFLLDVTPEQARERRSSDGEAASLDHIEAMPDDFHRRVYEGYLEIAGLLPRWVKIQAGGDAGAVHGLVMDAMRAASVLLWTEKPFFAPQNYTA